MCNHFHSVPPLEMWQAMQANFTMSDEHSKVVSR